MEPMTIDESSRHRGPLNDLVVELVHRSAGFRRSLPPGLVGALADLVRAMNCYYSNLIEGHRTHPVEIELALAGDYSADPEQRDLQLEARAHIAVQRWIDDGGLDCPPVGVAAIRAIHERFCVQLPDDLLWVADEASAERVRVSGGELRSRDVAVGRHVAVSPGAVPRFLERFEQAYARLGRADSILAIAAAHHRLLWIHPFMDGNGRVARLLSHAMLLDTLDTGAVWSVARGLACSVERYKGHLAACDLPRRNDLDGRGTLSEAALAAFTGYFLGTCVDQIDFMENLMQPGRLHGRILAWAQQEVRAGSLPSQAPAVVESVLFRGALARADVPGIVGTGERHARRVVAALTGAGVLTADSSRAPLRLAFPARLAEYWMPGLFPARSED
ncbi:MAG: Fic family protein [Alphaproteobacteria bacterium]